MYCQCYPPTTSIAIKISTTGPTRTTIQLATGYRPVIPQTNKWSCRRARANFVADAQVPERLESRPATAPLPRWTRTSQTLHHHHDQLCGRAIPNLSTPGKNTAHLRSPHPHLVRRVCSRSRLCDISICCYALVRANLFPNQTRGRGNRPDICHSFCYLRHRVHLLRRGNAHPHVAVGATTVDNDSTHRGALFFRVPGSLVVHPMGYPTLWHWNDGNYR